MRAKTEILANCISLILAGRPIPPDGIPKRLSREIATTQSKSFRPDGIRGDFPDGAIQTKCIGYIWGRACGGAQMTRPQFGAVG